jgi:hypothetical protein
MQNNPVNATPDLLSITVLPNGVVASAPPPGAGYFVNDLRASIVVTPSLASAGTLAAANFNHWPECVPQLKWSVTGNGQTANAIFETTVETPQNIRRYWNAIFGTGRTVSKRIGKKAITDPSTWLATHNIVKVGDRHSLHRFHHANAYLLRNARKANWMSDAVAAQLSMADTAAPVIYLYPQLSPSISDELKAAKTASDLILTLTAPDADHQAWLSRLAIARKMLETDENETLRGCSLLALMAVCAIDNAGNRLSDVIAQTKAAYTNLNPDFDTMQHYMETLLFQRRKPNMTAQKTLETPDFHQTLGLLQSYPALLRPLGFVFDIVIPRAGIADGDFKLSATFTCTDLPAALVQPVSNTTNVRLKGTSFFLVPQDPTYIDEGMLALNPNAVPAPKFVLITEDTDGTAAKFMQSSNSDGRAVEYSDASPAALVVQSAEDAKTQASQAGKPDPTTVPPIPSARTCGIALQHEDRLKTLQTSANAIKPDAPTNAQTAQQDLFADQLVLGFRVDVKYKGVWYSLCERSTQRYLLGIPSGQQIPWNPTSLAELSADEGFVSLGATSTDTSDPDDADPSEQLHVHQTIFNWSGGSLVLAPRPAPERTPYTPTPAPIIEHRLYVYATYNDPKEHSLAPLRFNSDYTFRCRVVDLAGNSRPFEKGEIKLLDGATPKMQVTFARQEPIRGPQFLLTRPLDPKNRPSEHINRIVLRNGADDSAQDRILVPPRESLRFAELHGILKDDKLPPTAFGNRALTRKGAFPSTRLALNQQWYEGPKPNPTAKNSELSDPIFITMDSVGRVSSRYYPDPLANYIRVEAWLLSDRPPLGRLLKAIWLEINPGNIWPELLPARIQLVASESHAPVKIEATSLPLNWKNPLDQAPTVTVTLPPAVTVILNISSAAVPGEKPYPKRPISTDIGAYHRAMQYVQTLAPLAAESYAVISQTPSTKYVDGTLPPVTPPATMTLVHAVPKPVAEPYLGPNFTVKRDMFETNGKVSGGIFAHWLSTGKITCHASYTDMVDDPKNPAPVYRTYSEAAFDLTPATTPAGANAPDPDPSAPASVYPRELIGLAHKFRDTRAHDVTYTLEASTRFREYYPGNELDANFGIKNETKFPVTVKSSVRPSAVSIAYILPTFTWAHSEDRGSPVVQRVAGARAYFYPPFGLSGNRECVCAVLATAQNPTAAEDQPMVSRWAADPIRNSSGLPRSVIEATQIGDSGDTTNGTVALLAEGGLAEVNIFAVTHAPERRLWFADIPFHVPVALNNMPFFRLALARWQPDGLFDDTHTTTLEARISNVVFADFMQLAPGRWASVSKRSNTHYTITLSGFIAPPSGEPITSSITIDIKSRWYALGIDLGWRTIEQQKSSANPAPAGTAMFMYRAATVGSPISQWTIDVHLPHSALFRKYRVLLREREQFAAPENGTGLAAVPSRPVFSQFIDLP